VQHQPDFADVDEEAERLARRGIDESIHLAIRPTCGRFSEGHGIWWQVRNKLHSDPGLPVDIDRVRAIERDGILVGAAVMTPPSGDEEWILHHDAGAMADLVAAGRQRNGGLWLLPKRGIVRAGLGADRYVGAISVWREWSQDPFTACNKRPLWPAA
jgi:hypothetical protein